MNANKKSQLQIPAHDKNSAVKLIQIVEDLDTHHHHFDLRYRHLNGEHRRLKVARSQGAGTVLQALLDAGAQLPHDPAKARRVIEMALQVDGVPTVAVTGRTGWHGDCFVLPDRTVGDHPQKLTFWDRIGTEPRQSPVGSVKAWRKRLAKACAQSSYLTFAVAVGFAGPLIRKLHRRDGFFFNLAGESSTGKTLASRAARSVIGCADNTGIHTPSAKERGQEELAFAHNDLLIVLDDLGRLKGSRSKVRESLRNLAYVLAGGRGMIRSKVVSGELPNLTWAVVGLTSWESPLSDLQRAEGEQVRLIDVPIPRRTQGGIFNLGGTDQDPERRKSLAHLVQTTVDANYGLAMPVFLEHLVDGGGDLVDSANMLIDNFVKSVRKDGNAFLDRFAEKFGIVLAAAHLAVDAEVAPWTKQQASDAIRAVYFDALTVLVTPEQAAEDFLKLLASRSKSEKRFPRVERQKIFPRKLKKTAYGFRRTLPKFGPVVAIRPAKFTKLAGSPARRQAILAELVKRGVLVKGAGDKSSKQLLVKGLSKKRRRYFVIPVKRLR